MGWPKFGPFQQKTDQFGNLARRGHERLDRVGGQFRQAVAQQRFDHRRLHPIDQGVANHLAHTAPSGQQAAMVQGGVANAIEQVGVGQRGAVLEQHRRDVEHIAQQEPAQGRRDLGQIGQPARHPGAFLDLGFAKNLHQQVGRHGALEGIDPAAGQADDVGQAFQQRRARPRDDLAVDLVGSLRRKGRAVTHRFLLTWLGVYFAIVRLIARCAKVACLERDSRKCVRFRRPSRSNQKVRAFFNGSGKAT